MENINEYKRRFYNLMESTLGDVKPLISEQNEPSFMQSIKNLYRDVFEGGDIDYNYIENSMTTKELADLIYASLKVGTLDRGKETKKEYVDNGLPGEYKLIRNAPKEMPKDYGAPDFTIDGDAEAPVEAAFLNMSKPLKKEGYCPECWKKYTEVSNLYKQRFNRYMLKDVKDNIDIYKKYHKKSINAIIKSWGGS
jgi:hypothetical protein